MEEGGEEAEAEGIGRRVWGKVGQGMGSSEEGGGGEAEGIGIEI